ncbi:voltage-gated potassium channel [Aureococcus anophagefferens]|nr:voltage-gated potassium channel [Aureococcus anophagefferens]
MAKLKKRMVQTDGIAMPDNTFVQIWDIMVLLLILVLFPLLPLMLAFPVISKTMRQFDTYCDIVFVVDIVKNFHVGYVDANDVLHMDRKEIAELSDGLVLARRRVRDQRAQVQDYYHFHISDAWIKLCKLFFFLIVLAHWMGCVSYALARFWNFPRSSWVVVAGLVDEDGANLKTVISQYSWCVCRALGLIVMESYESPYSSGTCVETDGWCTIETWTILLSLYVGSIFYAALISNISSIVGDMNVSKRRFEEMVHNTDEYMITKNIPRDLRERVREFYHLRYAKGRIFDEGQILDSLNAELRTEIASYNTRAVVSEGNSGDEMFFISNGMAEILLACGNVAIHVISDGCYFGEVAVLFDGKRTASIRTLSVTLGKAFAEDTPLPEKDDPEDKLTGLYGFEEQASAARLTHANSGHLAMLKNQPTKAELAILDEDRPSVSFSPAEVLEAASQERAKKLHDKQVRLLGKAERTRATVVQMKGSAGDQRHNVRKFARATGQF